MSMLRRTKNYCGKVIKRLFPGVSPPDPPNISPPLLPELNGKVLIIDSVPSDAVFQELKDCYDGSMKLISGDKSHDRYIAAASKMFNVPPDQVTPEQRKAAKDYMFGCQYGSRSIAPRIVTPQLSINYEPTRGRDKPQHSRREDLKRRRKLLRKKRR